MSETPRVDAATVTAGECYHTAGIVHADVAKDLERECTKLRDALIWIRGQTCGCNAIIVQTRIEEALAANQ